MITQLAKLQIYPVTPDRWKDFEKLFGQNGAPIIEVYPVDAVGEKKNATSVFTGVASTFKRVGFVEVARRTPTRPIMRYFVE